MTDLRTAAQQALEALIDASNVLSAPMFADAAAALRTALEQSEPPPEWEGINNIIAEYGLQAIDFVADWKATLGQAEPVAWGVFDSNLHDMFFTQEEAQEMVRLKGDGSTVAPLYTTPPQQQAEPVAQRKPLTDEEIQKIWDVASGGLPGWSRHITFARAIEAKLKEKNT